MTRDLSAGPFLHITVGANGAACIREAKARLEQAFSEASKPHRCVDVALASNMISVGVEIPRVGLMVVCGHPLGHFGLDSGTTKV